MTTRPDAATRLRAATGADADLIYGWRNNRSIVALGQSQRPVKAAEHRAWFAATLADPDRLMLIIEVDEHPAGQLRFERTGRDEARITIYMVGDAPGHGHGGRALALGEIEAVRRWPQLRRLSAAVLASNDRSLNYFFKMGFQLAERAAASEGASVIHLSKILAESSSSSAIRDHYDARVRRYGAQLEAVNWGSVAGQDLRFAVLADIGIGAGHRVLDVGCGLGDFAAYLKARGIAVDYRGIDVSAEMIRIASRRFPGSEFTVADVLTWDGPDDDFDFVVASGIFAVEVPDSSDRFELTVRRMYQLARRGAAFNSLSTLAPQHSAGEFHVDPAAAAGLAGRIAKRFTLRHDYKDNDFTVYLFKT